MIFEIYILLIRHKKHMLWVLIKITLSKPVMWVIIRIASSKPLSWMLIRIAYSGCSLESPIVTIQCKHTALFFLRGEISKIIP